MLNRTPNVPPIEGTVNAGCGWAACGDSTGSNWIEKDWVGVTPRLVWRKRGRGVVWFSVCEAPIDDWANGSSADVFFTAGKYGFSSMGI